LKICFECDVFKTEGDGSIYKEIGLTVNYGES